MIVVFLLLWRNPVYWTMLEEIFGKHPRTRWGRFSMNLILAAITATVVEDVFDFIRKGLYFLYRLLTEY